MRDKKAEYCPFMCDCVWRTPAELNVQAVSYLISHASPEDIHGGPNPEAECTPNHSCNMVFHERKSLRVASARDMHIAQGVQCAPLGASICSNSSLACQITCRGICAHCPEVFLKEISHSTHRRCLNRSLPQALCCCAFLGYGVLGPSHHRPPPSTPPLAPRLLFTNY